MTMVTKDKNIVFVLQTTFAKACYQCFNYNRSIFLFREKSIGKLCFLDKTILWSAFFVLKKQNIFIKKL